MNYLFTKGNPSFQTIGVISQYADIELIGCSISEHKEGGIMVFSDKTSKVVIDSCRIYDN